MSTKKFTYNRLGNDEEGGMFIIAKSEVAEAEEKRALKEILENQRIQRRPFSRKVMNPILEMILKRESKQLDCPKRCPLCGGV